MTVKSSISLTDDQDAFVRELVATGRYSSASAVLQQGVDLLQRKIRAEEADTEALRAILRERLDGEFVSAGTMRERVEALLAGKRRDANG
jgi:antitoxin ParD1/3/4